MSGCINGFWISNLTGNQRFNYLQYKPNIIMFFSVEFVRKVPFCLRLYSLSANDNQATLIGMRTPSFTGAIGFTSCPVKAKKNWIEILEAKYFWRSNNQPS